jgi:Arc/MetJ-type ribon-helix-helix transcriptional regulator
MPEPRVTIKIPRPLYERISASIEGSGFSSVTDFIVFVLRDLMMTEAGKKKEDGEGDLTREELDAIRKRLESLGYL